MNAQIETSETDACWNKVYYKDKTPSTSASIQRLPMQSLILSVAEWQVVRPSSSSTFKVSGIAWGGGAGNTITKVEVSTDHGESWMDATIHRDELLKDDTSKGKLWSGSTSGFSHREQHSLF